MQTYNKNEAFLVPNRAKMLSSISMGFEDDLSLSRHQIGCVKPNYLH